MFSTVKTIPHLSLPHSPAIVLLALISTVPWALCLVFLPKMPRVPSISWLPWCGQLGDKDCLCCAGVSSCVPSFSWLASDELTHWAQPSWLFLYSGHWRNFSSLSSWKFSQYLVLLNLLFSVKAKVQLMNSRCIGGEMLRKDDSVFT